MRLLDLNLSTCRMPVAGASVDTVFCGLPVKRGVYCGHCARIAYEKPRKIKTRAVAVEQRRVFG